MAQALTTITFISVIEGGRPGIRGTCHQATWRHPYHFTSRAAAAGLAAVTYGRGGCDGYALHTPGYVPPPRTTLDISADQIPF